MRAEKAKDGKGKIKPQREPGADKVHGEGNYQASRDYNDATRDFVQSDRVEEAAKKAHPHDEREREEMERAERKGRDESKGEDPALYRGGRKSSDAK